MDIKEIDSKKLATLLETICNEASNKISCAGKDCEDCYLQKIVQEFPGYKAMLHSIVMTSILQDPLDLAHPAHIAFLMGMVVAWKYRDAVELEQLLAK